MPGHHKNKNNKNNKRSDTNNTHAPAAIIARASASASSRFTMNAPLPYLTSRTSASAPLASFLDMIDATINGSEGTVPVTSLRAYIFLSAGAMPQESRHLRVFINVPEENGGVQFQSED